MGTKTLGQVGYEAYGEHPGPGGPYTTFDGRPMPKWEELTGGEPGLLTQARWETAAEAIRLEVATAPGEAFVPAREVQVRPLGAAAAPQEPILQYFEHQDISPHQLDEVVRPFRELAEELVTKVPRNLERTEALRKLLEAKEAAVRAVTAK